MSYDLRFTPAAVRDMDSLWEDVYAASGDFGTADKYVGEMLETIEKRQEFPFSGLALRYRGLFTGFYYVIYKKYLAFYRVHDNYMEVIRIILGKRDYMTVLFGQPEDLPAG